MKSKKRLVAISISVAALIIVAAAAFVIPQLFTTTSYSLPADIKTGDDLATVSDVVKATPTGESYKTKLKPDDDVEFRIVELTVTETLRGDVKGKINLLQTIGFDENPVLKEGQEYLLFLKPYVGPIPKTEGAYVSTSANWSYYKVDSNDVAKPVYDPHGEITKWVASIADKAPKGLTTQSTTNGYSLIQWLRDTK